MPNALIFLLIQVNIGLKGKSKVFVNKAKYAVEPYDFIIAKVGNTF